MQRCLLLVLMLQLPAPAVVVSSPDPKVISNMLGPAYPASTLVANGVCAAIADAAAARACCSSEQPRLHGEVCCYKLCQRSFLLLLLLLLLLLVQLPTPAVVVSSPDSTVRSATTTDGHVDVTAPPGVQLWSKDTSRI
jgi:hypothetical protein